MRKFATGATRDTDEGKLDYEAFFSPEVEREVARYLHRHRVQPDGSVRDGDNWQKLFSADGTVPDHLDVCIKSAHRHFMDLRLIHRGKTPHDPKTTSLEAACALRFNIDAYIFGLIQGRTISDPSTTVAYVNGVKYNFGRPM